MSVKKTYRTFYGGKRGFDIICFDNDGEIRASGKRQDMIKLANRCNYAVGKLYPIQFSSKFKYFPTQEVK